MATFRLLERSTRLPDPLSEAFLEAKEALRECRALIETNSSYMKYDRVLGWGEYGIVTMWKVYNQRGNHERNVAVKYFLHENEKWQLRNEIKWMKEFHNLEHFAQLVQLDENVLPRQYYNNEKRTQTLMIMEVFPRCDLQELIYRINGAAALNPGAINKRMEYIPTRSLWRIFLCLTRAIIGLAYRPPPISRNGTYREVVRDNRRARSVVHFDLDPANVFIGKFDSDPANIFGLGFDEIVARHRYVPALKLGDFGFSAEWKDRADQLAKQLIGHRGKQPYYAPEQRCETRMQSNGAFGSHTNVWGIGLIMVNLMTKSHPTINASEVRNVILHDNTPYQINTWAPYLVEPSAKLAADNIANGDLARIPYNLRLAVALCMSDDAKERPSLDELLEIIQENIQRGDEAARRDRGAGEGARVAKPDDWYRTRLVNADDEDDELISKFARDYFLWSDPYKNDIYEAYWDAAEDAGDVEDAGDAQ
ncbi:kinase-like domain-containing protein [Whalleya microplaca]|nr:kinase-like domain-containing protein [Whalleya microplaca]